MFKIGGVISSRSHDHRYSSCIYPVESLLQQVCIVSIVYDLIVAEGFWRYPAADFPGDHGVGSAGRNPEIILQNVPLSIFAKHQINSRNMTVDSLGRADPLTFRKIAGRNKYKLLRNYLILYDLFFSIYILQKKVQGVRPLDQSLFQYPEFLPGDHPGNSVKGK